MDCWKEREPVKSGSAEQHSEQAQGYDPGRKLAQPRVSEKTLHSESPHDDHSHSTGILSELERDYRASGHDIPPDDSHGSREIAPLGQS